MSTRSSSGDLRPGARFAHLTIQRRLGRGSYGEVWLAFDPDLERQVALKVLDAELIRADEGDAELLAEARAMARLNHPNIATLFGRHSHAGRWALEMEHVAGGTLESRLARGTAATLRGALALLRGVAAGLEASHAAGVVHGDLKPGNVLLSSMGVPKLADFGLARLLGARDRAEGADPRGGTPAYMAPEALMGGALDRASDVWSFGVLAYRVLGGQLPFVAETLHGLFHSVSNTTPASLPTRCPAAAAAVIARCLDRRPGRRPSWPEIRAALEDTDVGAQPGGGPAPTPQAPAPAHVGREADVEAVVRACGGDAIRWGAVVVLAGPVGIGKSTVADAVCDVFRARGVCCVTVGASSTEGVLRPLASELQAEIARTSSEHVPPTTAGGARVGPSAQVDRSARVLAATGPVLVVVENIHVVATAEAQALSRAVRRLCEVPIAWLATERSSELAEGHSSSPAAQLLGGPRASVHRVGPLSRDAIDRLLADRVAPAQVSTAIVAEIAARSAGNPLFAIQLFEHLRVLGAIRRHDGMWDLDPSAASTGWPSEVRSVVLDRVRALSAFDRSVLEAAAVDGYRFDGAGVAGALSRSTPVLRVLRALQRGCEEHGLVVAERSGYRFVHPVVQEVLYEDVPPELRKAFHRRLAEHLAARDVPPDPERLGTHWERAGETEAARPLLLDAAHRAARRVENVRAVELATRAGVSPSDLTTRFAREHADELLWVAAAHSDLGHEEEVEALFAVLLAAAEEFGDRTLRARVVVRRTNLRFHGRVGADSDDDLVREATSLLPMGYDLARAHYYLGVRARIRGELAEAERHLRESAAVARRANELGITGSILDQQASVVLRAGRREEAIGLYSRAAAACRECGQHANAAISEVNGILVAMGAGRLEGQVERLLAAQRTLEIEGMPKQAADLGVRVAQAEYALGRTAAALQTVATARVALAGLGHELGLVGAAFVHAELLLVTGRIPEARAALAELRALPPLGGERDRARMEAIEARLALVLGEADRARDLLERARATIFALPEPDLQLEFLLNTGEMTVWGLDPSILRSCVESSSPSRASPAPSAHLGWTIGRGVLAFLERTPAEELVERAADALRVPEIVQRRAAHGILADVLEAAAAPRRSLRTGARAAIERARSKAAALEHRWWTLFLRAGRSGRGNSALPLPSELEERLEAEEIERARRWWSKNRLSRPGRRR